MNEEPIDVSVLRGIKEQLRGATGRKPSQWQRITAWMNQTCRRAGLNRS